MTDNTLTEEDARTIVGFGFPEPNINTRHSNGVFSEDFYWVRTGTFEKENDVIPFGSKVILIGDSKHDYLYAIAEGCLYELLHEHHGDTMVEIGYKELDHKYPDGLVNKEH